MKKTNLSIRVAIFTMVFCLIAASSPLVSFASEYLYIDISLEGRSGDIIHNVEIALYDGDTRIPVQYDDDVNITAISGVSGLLTLAPDRRTSDIDRLRLVVLSGIAAGHSFPLRDFPREGNRVIIALNLSSVASAQTDPPTEQPPTPPPQQTPPPTQTGGSRVLRFLIDSVNYTDAGQTRTLLAAPFIQNGRTMVPLRVIAEALGGENLNFDRASQTITFVIDGQGFSMVVGQELPGNMGTPVILEGTTFVPLAFVINEIGAEARWDGAARAAYVYM